MWSVSILIKTDTLFLRASLHFTTLHYTCRYFTSSHLNFTRLHFTTLSFGLTPSKLPTAPFHIISIHFTALLDDFRHTLTIFAKYNEVREMGMFWHSSPQNSCGARKSWFWKRFPAVCGKSGRKISVAYRWALEGRGEFYWAVLETLTRGLQSQSKLSFLEVLTFGRWGFKGMFVY